jgi:hypothetical protein
MLATGLEVPGSADAGTPGFALVGPKTADERPPPAPTASPPGSVAPESVPAPRKDRPSYSRLTAAGGGQLVKYRGRTKSRIWIRRRGAIEIFLLLLPEVAPLLALLAFALLGFLAGLGGGGVAGANQNNKPRERK